MDPFGGLPKMDDLGVPPFKEKSIFKWLAGGGYRVYRSLRQTQRLVIVSKLLVARKEEVFLLFTGHSRLS